MQELPPYTERSAINIKSDTLVDWSAFTRSSHHFNLSHASSCCVASSKAAISGQVNSENRRHFATLCHLVSKPQQTWRGAPTDAPGCYWSGVLCDPGYMSRKIRKFRTNKFDTWKTEILTHATHVNGCEPAVYMSCMSQNFRLFHVSNLSVWNFRFFTRISGGLCVPCRWRDALPETRECSDGGHHWPRLYRQIKWSSERIYSISEINWSFDSVGTSQLAHVNGWFSQNFCSFSYRIHLLKLLFLFAHVIWVNHRRLSGSCRGEGSQGSHVPRCGEAAVRDAGREWLRTPWPMKAPSCVGGLKQMANKVIVLAQGQDTALRRRLAAERPGSV